MKYEQDDDDNENENCIRQENEDKHINENQHHNENLLTENLNNCAGALNVKVSCENNKKLNSSIGQKQQNENNDDDDDDDDNEDEYEYEYETSTESNSNSKCSKNNTGTHEEGENINNIDSSSYEENYDVGESFEDNNDDDGDDDENENDHDDHISIDENNDYNTTNTDQSREFQSIDGNFSLDNNSVSVTWEKSEESFENTCSSSDNENNESLFQSDVESDENFSDHFDNEESQNESELTNSNSNSSNNNKIKMGQPNSKTKGTSKIRHNSENRNKSENRVNNKNRAINENRENFEYKNVNNVGQNQKSLPINNNSNNENNSGNNTISEDSSEEIPVIPKITVSDHCDPNIKPNLFLNSNNQNPKLLSPNVEQRNPQMAASSTSATTTIDIVDIEDDDEDEEEWHFVSNNNNNNNNEDQLTSDKKFDKNNYNENIDDPTTTSFSISTTTTTITKNTEKQTDSFDSGIGRSSSRVLLIDSRQLDDSKIIDENYQKHDNNQAYIQINGFDNYNSLNSGDYFVRGNSTDCDDNYLQSDQETYENNIIVNNSEEKYCENHQRNYQQNHKIIDSISLPDVVAESAGMGVSESVPIKVEDFINSTITATTTTTSNDINDNLKGKTIKLNLNSSSSSSTLSSTAIKSTATATATIIPSSSDIGKDYKDNEKCNLNNQAAANLINSKKLNELQSKIDQLENDLSVKSWNVERLQGELKAAQKEDECIRKKLKILEEEKESLRQKCSELEDNFNNRYEKLEIEYKNLQDKYEQIQITSNSLKAQLAFAQSDAKQCRLDKDKLQAEKELEIKELNEKLGKLQEEQKAVEKKWNKEFEELRTRNAEHEEHLMSDCEWKIRTMQKKCKEKLEQNEKEKNDALEKATEIENMAKEQIENFEHLKSYEVEVRQLRGLTQEQRQSIISLNEKIDELRSELEYANEQLEEQIETIQKIRKQCENKLSDKDRELVKKIDEVRNDISEQWQYKLITEMTRLKCELEAVSIEERQDIIHRLQTEHIEEIKVLTSRYNSNEEELRMEIESLQKQLVEKDKDYRELKLKSEEALFQSRLHLEKADRDYICAMNREEEMKEKLIKSLNENFEKEKEKMEEKFCERLAQAKKEYAKELSIATEELAIKHRKQLEYQWEQLNSEKEEAIQALEKRHRLRLDEADCRIQNLEIEHQRNLKEVKSNYDLERSSLESRDLKNTQEIEQLHRKCRCLTNLFDEMRMRYERRDPRPEDIREISELRSRCEEQEYELRLLTERLRELQMQVEHRQQSQSDNRNNKVKSIRKPPPKNIPISCDVIYEENEENEQTLENS